MIFSEILFAKQEKGKGIGFDCTGKIYLADTYKKIDEIKSFYLSTLTEENLIEAAFNTHHKMYKENNAKLRNAYKNLTFKEVDQVPFAGDDKIEESDIPNGCIKVAIAHQDIKTGIVEINRELFNKLSIIDKAFLKFHEAFIQFYEGINNTSIVKNLVGENLLQIFINTIYAKVLIDPLDYVAAIQDGEYDRNIINMMLDQILEVSQQTSNLDFSYIATSLY